MSTTRRVAPSPIYQGTDESIVYRFDFTNWGTPTSGSVSVLDLGMGTDVTSLVTSGSPAISTYFYDTPSIYGLTDGSRYRMTCRVDIPPNIESAYVDIIAE